MSAELLVVDGLSVTLPTEDGPVHAVRAVSFAVRRGEILGVVGESGSGKSVTALAIMGLLPDNARLGGSIRFAGQELVGRAEAELRGLRGNRVAMVFQDPMTALNPVLTVGWQLAEAYRVHHRVGRAAARARALEVLDRVGIARPDRRAEQYPHEFSGGMRQRVVLAMAIVNDPELIIADEPTTALDVTVQAQILQMLHGIRDTTGAALIMITHDLGVIAGLADRVQVMYAGTVVETGEVHDVYAAPRMPYTKGLLAAVPNPALAGERLAAIPGVPPSLRRVPTGCPFAPRCPLVAAECRASEPPLAGTDRPEHLVRCHRWGELA